MILLKKFFVDTSALMSAYLELEQMIEEDKINLIVCSTVLEELDKHKDGESSERAFKARRAFKLLNNNRSHIIYVVDEVPDEYITKTLFNGFDMNHNDNKILYACFSYMENHEDVVLLTNDNGMICKCNMLDIPSERMSVSVDEDMYKGYIELFGTEEENDNALYDLMKSGSLHANQYIILHDSDTGEDEAVRWDAELQNYVGIFIPTKANNRELIKPLNIYQACALDLLNNDNIPIKVISGTYGSGKTMMTMKIMESKLETGLYDRLMLLRNPIAVDDIDIGALPGDKHSKLGHFFTPMLQYLKNDTMCEDVQEAFDPNNIEFEKQRGYKLDMEIIQHLKGVSVDRTIMVLDEAEDLSLKLIKTTGTRIGEGSQLIMMGDLVQAENKYKYNNGLSAFVEQTKDERLVGVIYLPMDVRSPMSKIFADLS